MNPYDRIKAIQRQWARDRGIDLVSSVWRPGLQEVQQDARGEKNYTRQLDENLFSPLTPETRREFEAGKGGELS